MQGTKVFKLLSYVKAFIVVFIFFLIVFVFTFVISDFIEVENLKSLAEYFEVLLSSAIVSLVSVILVYVSLQDGNKSKMMENQLRLREMFATERRIWIHEQLYIYPEKDRKTLRKEYAKDFKTGNSNHDIENEFDLALYDYIGLFELCNYLIKEGQLDREVFFNAYSYRLYKLTKSKVIQEELEGSPEYWIELKKIIEQNKALRKRHGLSDL